MLTEIIMCKHPGVDTGKNGCPEGKKICCQSCWNTGCELRCVDYGCEYKQRSEGVE